MRHETPRSEALLDEGRETRDLGFIVLLGRTGEYFNLHLVLENRAMPRSVQRFVSRNAQYDLETDRASTNLWKHVQPEIARFSRVCSYDRAGYGGSDAGPMPRTSAQIALELHTLLYNAGEAPPYLLVGHSFGGYSVRVLNGEYPDQVVGIVLADATQEDQYELLPATWGRIYESELKRYKKQARWAPNFYRPRYCPPNSVVEGSAW